MPTEARALLAADTRIGSLKFPAARGSGEDVRRLAAKPGVKRDGATHDDLGADARREVLVATLDEITFQKLRRLHRDAKVYTVVHPLFPVFQGRIASIAYEFTDRSHIETTITVVEEGDYEKQEIDADEPRRGLTTTAIIARSRADDAFADLEAIGELPDLPGDFADNQAQFNASWTGFDDALAAAELGEVEWTSLAGSFSDLTLATTTLAESIEDAVTPTGDILFSDFPAIATLLLNDARRAVDEAQAQTGRFWQEFEATGAMLLSQVALEFLGSATERNIDQILGHNPELIDITVLPPGTRINLPIVPEAL